MQVRFLLHACVDVSFHMFINVYIYLTMSALTSLFINTKYIIYSVYIKFPYSYNCNFRFIGNILLFNSF